MTEIDPVVIPDHELEHPAASVRTLVKASIFAVVFGLIVLVAAILPAEYNIDPTGLGAAMGLTRLVSVEPINSPPESQVSEFREGSAEIIIPAGSGLEYKLEILKGDAIRYSWESIGDELFFDFHGEPKGDTTGYFESYTVSTADSVRGSLTAPFDGSHGWYWKNESNSPVTVSLKFEGNYEIIGIK